VLDKEQKACLRKARKLLQKAIEELEKADFKGLASRVESLRCETSMILDHSYEEDE
jgi:hypothetical protein